MYYLREDIGLEIEKPEIVFPTFPSFDDCPDKIEDDSGVIEDKIRIGQNAVSDLDKMKKLLKEVARRIRSQPSTGEAVFSKTGH